MDIKIEMAQTPASTSAMPTTPEQLTTQATMGAILAIFGCSDWLLREGKMNKALQNKVGISALQRMYNEADKMNHHFEKVWDLEAGDQMQFLHRDTAIVMMVLVSVDLESRTNLTNEFRKVWAMLLENLGDKEAVQKVMADIALIRDHRKLAPRPEPTAGNPTDVFDKLGFNVDGTHHELGEVPRLPPTAAEMIDQAVKANQHYYTAQEADEHIQQGLAEGAQERAAMPHNCMVFVRDVVTRQLVDKAKVSVDYFPTEDARDRVHLEMWDYDGDGLYERFYPTNGKVLFTAFSDDYLAGGCEKFFYEGDVEQLVVNIFLTRKPVA